MLWSVLFPHLKKVQELFLHQFCLYFLDNNNNNYYRDMLSFTQCIQVQNCYNPCRLSRDQHKNTLKTISNALWINNEQ